MFFNAPFSDVIFLNSSRGGTKYLVPLLYLLAKLFKTKFVFRPFGGDIKDYTTGYNNFQKWIFRNTVLKSDVFFLQTKELMQFYANQNANTIQLPTSRKKPSVDLLRGAAPYARRFIYLGFVNQLKGIDHILEAAQQLGPDYTIHVYGPIKEDRYKQIFEEHPNVYQGVLAKKEVLPTLREYDVLVLPTYYGGEGYPGAILEAYSLGLPVITTKWKAIPEIVEDGETGLLIQPQSTEALVKAMQHFNTNNYPQFSEHAETYFNYSFNTDMVTERAIRTIKLLNVGAINKSTN